MEISIHVVVDRGRLWQVGGSVAFSAITGSTNTTAAMVLGTGSSLNTSGTGGIGGDDSGYLH